jgi:hypothetical protein
VELMLEHIGGPSPLTHSKYSNQCMKRAEKITKWHTNVCTFLDSSNDHIFLLEFSFRSGALIFFCLIGDLDQSVTTWWKS